MCGSLPGEAQVAHARAGRAPVKDIQELFKIRAGTFGGDFNGTIGQVAHPAAQQQAAGLFAGEKTEPHSLHMPGNDGMQTRVW